MFERFLSRKRPEPPPPAPVETAADMQATVRAIQRLATPHGFRFAEGCPETVLATAFGVCALEVLGALDDALTPERKETIATFLRDNQSPETGLIRDPRHDDAFLFGLRKFTPLYVEWQETYFALHALDALDQTPDHPLTFAEPYKQPAIMDGWLRMLRYDDFWFSSNYLMFLLLFFVLDEGRSSPSAHRLLDRLDERQDPDTGLWGTKQGASLFNGVAGAFHIYGFYRYLDRPIAHQPQAIRSTLETQESTGLFSGPGGGPCEDLDAVDILANLATDPADEPALRHALDKALYGLRACRRDDAGYRWSAPFPQAKVRKVTYSGLPSLTVPSDGCDLWSIWFRPLAIALACHRLGREVAWPVTYRRLPLLGFGPNG